MTTSRIQRTVAQYRADLLAEEAKAVATLEHYYSHTVMTSIKPKLDKIYSQILKKMEAGEAIPQSWINECIRQENLQLLISGKIDQYSALALQQTRELQHTGVDLGIESAKAQVDTVVPHDMRVIINKYLPESRKIKAVFGMPSETAIQGLIGATQKGSPLHTLFNGWGKEVSDKAIKALVSGVTNGDNPETIAPRVAKALNISKQRARVLVRNEALRCYKSANLLAYRANSDVLGQWQWSAVFSDRTCGVCLAMDGTLHDLDEEFDSHIQCRCSPIPVSKPWSDILEPLGIDASDIPDTSYSPSKTGEQWFEEQSAKTQQKILGSRSAYELYSSGKVSLQDFVGEKHDDAWGGSRYQKSVRELVNA